jgi:hypothetical protein
MPGRELAFQLLKEAADYYAGDPLLDHFSHSVAEMRYELRAHWGEKNAHVDKVREQFVAIIRRAELHKRTGSGLLAQHFFRGALQLAEEHRQYFTGEEVADLMREEQAAIKRSIEAGEFTKVAVSMEIPAEQVRRVRATAEETIAGLVSEVAKQIPTRESVEAVVRKGAADAPIHTLFAATVMSDGKVVGESRGQEKNIELEIERHAILVATLAGQTIATTIVCASEDVGLTGAHAVAPLAPLALDVGTLELIRHGCELMIAQDFVSACHVLVPRVEDVLRQSLRAQGLHATEFKRDVGDGTSRTDDEPLGSMLARTLPSGVTVRNHLGEDFAEHIERTMTSQTGLNLRHVFAHGIARPRHCTPENAGIVLGILYKLADVAAVASSASTAPGPLGKDPGGKE